MLTSKASTEAKQQVVTDVNANVELPPSAARSISPEMALLANKAIIARPLMAPEVCSVHVKNTEYRYRWVNRDGQHGRFYMMRRAQGFTPATKDDVEILGGDVQTQDGEIRAGDLVLMKIRADIYDAAIKHNMQKAAILGAARGVYLKGASSDVNSDSTPQRVSVSSEPFVRNGIVKPFIPDNPDAIIDDSISAGRVEASRKQVDALRDQAHAEK